MNLRLIYCKKVVFFFTKKHAKMPHNETAGYWRAGQNAPIFILNPKMNSSCPITYKSTYNM